MSSSADTASSSPSNTPSTVPSAQLRAHPATPRRAASRRTESRKKTPCTWPWARKCLRTVMPGYLPGVDAFESALEAAGGAYAPASATAQLKALLADALHHGRRELTKARSGYDG